MTSRVSGQQASADEAFEGDYRPPTPGAPAPATPPRALFHEHAANPNIRVEPLQLEFLQRLADALNTTLDLNTLMHRVADLVRAVIDYRIFAILLVSDRSNELRMRFQTGHTAAIERLRIKLGRGISGSAAQSRKSILVEDVSAIDNYINANPSVRSELAVPLIVKNRVIGVIDLQSEVVGFFTEDHQRLLELVASRMATAIENARLYTRVSRQAHTLTVLQEMSRELTSILDPDDLLERIGATLKRVVDFHMFTILLWNQVTEQFEHRFSTRYGERVQRERNVRRGEGLIGTAARERMAILAPDTRKDARYREDNAETRSELTVPLIYKGNVIGILDVEHTRANYYNEDHLRTLNTIAPQLAISIVNARLYQRIHDEEQRMERELDMARVVQLRLLPQSAPVVTNAELAVSFRPARSIGGDLYDFLDFTAAGAGGKRIVVALGDVSGKAAPAALYAALVSGILRSLAPSQPPPAALLALLNAQLQERKVDSQYVTMLVGQWEDETRTLRVANAGSAQPLLVRRIPAIERPPDLTHAYHVETIAAEGFPLGLFPRASYDELTLTLTPGDLVLFFSDGLPDAVNLRGEQFGTDRLHTLLMQHPTAMLSAQQAVEAVLEAVSTHQSGVEHFDDETLVALRVR
jgi:sigma-B regulation protein RsbU (phosphoserine phosphatase)